MNCVCVFFPLLLWTPPGKPRARPPPIRERAQMGARALWTPTPSARTLPGRPRVPPPPWQGK
eukprot:2030700-Pyramimonas_sp.AAC.1